MDLKSELIEIPIIIPMLKIAKLLESIKLIKSVIDDPIILRVEALK